ncbi:PAS domain S-box protein, partial [Thermoplasmatota archaeon]
MGGLNLKSLTLAEISELYKKSINSFSYLFMIVDAKDKFNIVAINKSMALSFGGTEEELIGKNILNILPPELSKSRKKYAKEVIKTKKPVLFEDERNGRWFLTNICPLNNDKDIVTHLLVFAEDITKRKEIESKLKKRENELIDIGQKFQIITEYMTDFVFQITLTGKFTHVNPVSERYGYKPEEMIGKNFTKFVPKKELPRYFSQIKKMISGEKIDCFESFVIHKNGHLIPTEFSGQMVKVGKKRYINGIMRNISERKKNELILKESEEKFRVLSDQSLMGLGIIQGEQIKYANDAIVQITEYSKDEMFSEGAKLLSKIVHPDDLSFVQKQLQKKLSGDKDVISRYSCRIISKTGELKWVEIFSKTIHYEGKNADLVTFVDITERKKTEEKLRTIIDNANDGIAIQDDNWQIKYVNPKTLEILGYTKKELLDINVKDIIDPSEIKKALNRKKSRSSGIKVPSYFEIKIIDKKGNIHYLENNIVTIEWDGLPAHLTFIRDATELITARKEIVQRKEYLQKVIDSTTEIIFTVDSDYKIKTWNKTAEQITGYKKRQVV